MPTAPAHTRPPARPDSGRVRTAWVLSGLLHGAAVTAFLIYQAIPPPRTSQVAVFEMVNATPPKLRPLAPKSPEPPPPEKKPPARPPEAPKLTSKPKPTAVKPKPEPKTAQRPALDTTLPIRETPQENSVPTTSVVANVPADPRLTFWAGRVKKRVETLWNPPSGIDVSGPARTVVSFRVARDGAVTGVEVTQSSGNALLDDLAKRTLLRLDHVPPIPENFPDDLLQVSYEFLYQGQ